MPRQPIWMVIAAALVIGLGIILFIAQPKEQDHSAMKETNDTTMTLGLDPISFDFGTISMKNGLVSKTFKVKNTQENSIDLSTVYTSCMCTQAKIVIDGQEYDPFGMQGHGAMKMLNKTLAPEAEADLIVIFDPNAHGPSGIGAIERTVTLESEKGEVVSVNIKANVTP